MTSKKLIHLCAFSLLSFYVPSCFQSKNQEHTVMKVRGVLRISGIEKGEFGNLLIFGEVVNETRSSILVPWLGDAEKGDGVVMTTLGLLGLLEYKDQDEWKEFTEFNDGISPLVPLQAGQSIKFCVDTTVPFPEEKRTYRLTMSNLKPVEFANE